MCDNWELRLTRRPECSATFAHTFSSLKASPLPQYIPLLHFTHKILRGNSLADSGLPDGNELSPPWDLFAKLFLFLAPQQPSLLCLAEPGSTASICF
jgi:hypothetical protein